jgi:hypothetical protein
MLTSLSLTNFKSWKQIEGMRLAPVTGLFGTNSSGKSSILQLLLLLKQTVESSDRKQVLNFGDEQDYVALGSFRDVVHKGASPRQLGWSIAWDLPERQYVFAPIEGGSNILGDRQIRFDTVVTEGRSRLIAVRRFEYEFDDRVFGMERLQAASSDYRLFTTPAMPEVFEFRQRPSQPASLPSPVKFYGFPDQTRASYENAGFLADFELALERLFGRIYYLGPLRESPQREYRWAGTEPADVGRRGEKAIAALLAADARGRGIAAPDGGSTISVGEHVARKLKELKLICDFAVRPVSRKSDLYHVVVKQNPLAPEVLLTDVGFGVSQVLPVLVLCYYVPEGSSILLEQPEIHLHPSVQADLADVLIDAVKTRRIQIIVESHSEHLLLRLQRRIAEEKFSNNDAALYFCKMADDASELMPLALDEYGNISNWPDDFFGDAFEESALQLEAEMERKKQEAA